MSKKQSTQEQDLVKLQQQYDELAKLNKPTEEQLLAMEELEAKIAQLEVALNNNSSVEGYEVPEGEADYVHIKMYTGNRFDPETGEEIAKYAIQKFNAVEFKNFERQASRLGYKYRILHEPKNVK